MSSDLVMLLVEDDDVDREIFARFCKEFKLCNTIIVAESGDDALARLAAQPELNATNLLPIVDLDMPSMNGFELLEALRAEARFSDIPAIVLTTSDNDQDVLDAHAHAVASYLVKPISFGKLFLAFAGLGLEVNVSRP